MKQLSGMDNLFLELDSGHQHMHVASLGIYDPSTAAGGKVRFKDILRFFSGRLNQSKVFRRRLVSTPLGLDRPYWIDDANIDLEYHIRHIALPHPGDWRQLCIQVARLHSRAMDFSMPVWECYIIEGLDNIPGVPPGSFAMYTKIHHSAIDGESGTELIKALHSLTPEMETASGNTTVIADRDPTKIELYARALGNRLYSVVDTSKLLLDVGQTSLGLGKKYLYRRLQAAPSKEPKGPSALPPKAPITRFDHAVSPHRVVEALGLPMGAIQGIRSKVPEVTVNDIFMAVTGGALRKYLEGKHELPRQSLSAMVPLSTRGADKSADVGNQVGMTAMPIYTDIEDPIERLLAMRRGSKKSKEVSEAVGKDLSSKLVNLLPAVISKKLINALLARANLTISNVRGPSVPLYMAGAKMLMNMPVSIAFDNLGLNITGFSYNGMLWVCIVCCREMMPDPAVFTQCYQASFDELVKAAEQHKSDPKAAVSQVKKLPTASKAPLKKVVTKPRSSSAKSTASATTKTTNAAPAKPRRAAKSAQKTTTKQTNKN